MTTFLKTTKRGEVERHGQCKICHTDVRVPIDTRDNAIVFCPWHKIAVGTY